MLAAMGRVVPMVVTMVPAVVRAMGTIMAAVVMRLRMIAVNGGVASMCVVVAALSMGRAGREGFCACVGVGYGVLRLAVAKFTVAR